MHNIFERMSNAKIVIVAPEKASHVLTHQKDICVFPILVLDLAELDELDQLI